MKKAIKQNAQSAEQRQIDMSYVEEMSDGDPAFRKEIIKLFLGKIPAEIIQLNEAFANNDYKIVKKLTHNMRSSLDIFMLQDLSELIAYVEKEASNGEFTAESGVRIGNFNLEIKKVLNFLQNSSEE